MKTEIKTKKLTAKNSMNNESKRLNKHDEHPKKGVNKMDN